MARIRPRTEIRAGPATVSGTSVAPVQGTGASQAQPHVTVGAATREVKGSGVLITDDAVIVGANVTEIYIPGSFNVDPINGSDLFNGILVGETGSGTTLNGVAGTGPKRTVQSVVDAIEAGQYAQGDLFFFEDGAPHLIDHYNFWNNLGTTKAWNQATFDADPYAKDPNVLEFRNMPGKEPILSTQGASQITNGTGYGPWILKGNARVSGFELQCGSAMFYFGGNGTGTGPSAGAHVHRCRQIQTYTSAERPMGTQSGPIKAQGANATGFTIQESAFRGAEQSSDNNCTVYCETLGPDCMFLDSLFDYPNVTLGHTLHFKYPSSHALDDWLFRGCLATSNNLKDIIKAADGNSGVTFRHSIVWMRQAVANLSRRYDNTEGDTGTLNQPPAIQAYQKRMYNCGYYNPQDIYNMLGIWAVNWTVGSAEGTEWEFFDNELMGMFFLSGQTGSVGRTYTELLSADRNVYGNGGNTHNRGWYTPSWPGTYYTLSQWKAYQSYMGAGADDANSVDGPIVFLNPGAQDPEDMSTFERDPTTPKYGVAGPNIAGNRKWAGAGVGTWL